MIKTIGILGGGQLGRMLSMAAARLGIRVHIYEPQSQPPAGDVATRVFTAGYDDVNALRAFAKSVDIVTFEFENIPAAALDIVEAITPVLPRRNALEVSQDRITEKHFLQAQSAAVAPFVQVDTLADLQAALGVVGTPAILKTRRFGYDGKGQVRITALDQAEEAFASLAGAPAVLEQMIPFEREISIIAARNANGEVACFDPGENVHKEGILHTTTVPASISHALQTDAVLLAARILNALDYVGIMGVELFVTSDGLMVNEIAPRVHNSGHWTQDACLIDQFEQHIRAIAGWPLGDGQRHSDAEMTNLIGDDVNQLEEWHNSAIHLYGKVEVKSGRKMGHVNNISPISA
ncbi:MAG: 5-(carboxyamino)imidazole ribonucleotide synthase [Rhodobacteraceae bacterium]|nr:5-(carboxyamino)imidazole ribonucleotide synthase [Paracoccaceae bacterium]